MVYRLTLRKNNAAFRSVCEMAEEEAEVEQKFQDVIDWVELNKCLPSARQASGMFFFYLIVNLVCVSAQLNMTSTLRNGQSPCIVIKAGWRLRA